MDTLYGFSWISPSTATVREMADLFLMTWIYPGSFGRRELGYKVREKAPDAIDSLLKKL